MLTVNDLSRKLTSNREEILAAVAKVVDRGWTILGPEVSEFETSFSKYLGASYCVGVANGTDALELGLRSLGVGIGDRVLTVANAGIYSDIAIRAIGAFPVYLDIHPDTHHPTLEGITTAINRCGIRALILTHLYGRAVRETEAITELCKERGIRLLEDCAQAHGAEISHRKVGTFGHAAAFSFYPTKNLGAIGDGGAVVTSDHDLAERLRGLRQYGWKHKYLSEIPGGRNSRLDELQAAVLHLFLSDLDEQNIRRRTIGERYHAGIEHPLVQTPVPGGADDVVHLYVIRCSDRDGLRSWLSDHGIGSDIHYPTPSHMQPIHLSQSVDMPLSAGLHLPITEKLAREVLTLPCYPELTNSEVDKVILAINNWPK